VLLDFSEHADDPAIAYLGRALREECGLEADAYRIGEVPGRSLLSRLTDHYLQIIANRAPIGFEAEFIGTRGHTTLYRGILMPFSSDGEAIDFIYGVINWKELVDDVAQAVLAAELDAAPVPASPADAGAAWADGPGAGAGEPDAPLDKRLEQARESAAAAQAADARGRGALYRALGRAHDFALAAEADGDGYRRLLAEAGVSAQKRAPMTAVAKLVFGSDYDKTRLTEYAAVLTLARARALGAGELAPLLEATPGGVKAVVAEARAARRPARAAPPSVPDLSDRPVLARLDLPVDARPGAPVLLVARVGEGGRIEVVGALADQALTARAVATLGRGRG
jgi:hypothetical protein